MRALIALSACALAACATPMTASEAYGIAQGSQDWELCYIAVSGKGQPALRNAVYSVMQTRRVDCNQHAALVAARLQQDGNARAAQAQLGIQLLQASRPQPVAPPTSIQCRTVNRGAYLQTVCD